MSPLSFHTNIQADWCNDRSQRAKTHSGTPAKQQSATKSVLLRKSIFMLFFYSELVSIDTVQHAEHCTFTREDFPQPNLCQPLNAAFCSTVFQMFWHLVAYVKQSHQSYQHIQVLPEINFRATRQVLGGKKSKYTHFMAHPVGNIADQISRCLLQRYLSSVFQHNYPYANNLRLSLLIFLTGKQTDWHAYTQTPANLFDLQDRGTVPLLFREN